MSTLEKKLDALIASQDHIRPDEVTLEHIRSVRDQDVNVKYDTSTRYGGFNSHYAKILTPARSREIIETAYRFLMRFGKKP